MNPTEQKDGGPAFPTFHPEWRALHDGMSLRDYFAGQATEADIHIHMEWPGANYGGAAVRAKYSREQARYRYADAMLKARATAQASLAQEKGEV